MTGLLLFFSAIAFASELPPNFVLANNYYLQGNFEEAAKSYVKVLEDSPDILEAYLNAAILYRNQGKLDLAVELLKKAAKLDKKNALVNEELAWLAYLNNDLKTAKKAAKVALKINNEAPLGLLVLGAVFQEKGKFAESLEPLGRLAQAMPLNILGPWFLAQSYVGQDNLETAADAYKKILDADYTMLEARLPLAQILKKMGRSAEAKKSYDLILDVDPQNTQAQQETSDIMLARASPEPAVNNKAAQEPAAKEILSEPDTEIPSTKPAPAKKATRPLKIPQMRIALGTSSSGKPLPRSGVMFRAKGGFKIIRKNSKKLIAQGKFGEVWTIQMGSSKSPSLEIVNPKGKMAGRFAEAIQIQGLKPKTIFVLHNVPYGQGFAWAGNHDREYRGLLEVSPREEEGLMVVNTLSLEDYLQSVLASEMFPSWPLETLKAQTIIARSVALYKQKYERPHKSFGYHLCDGQHCQVYIGVDAERARTRQAVVETQGEILTYNRKTINALYHANCGGRTHAANELAGWWGAPYLASQKDTLDDKKLPQTPWDFELWMKSRPQAYCSLTNHAHPLAFRWIRAISAQDLEGRILRTHDIGSLLWLEASRRTSAGYVTALKITGSKSSIVVGKEHEIRRLLGLGQIRSNLFVLDIKKNKEGRPSEIFIFGGGWGHGVGLCQAGAAGLAQAKKATYAQILAHYYHDVRIEKLAY